MVSPTNMSMKELQTMKLNLMKRMNSPPKSTGRPSTARPGSSSTARTGSSSVARPGSPPRLSTSSRPGSIGTKPGGRNSVRSGSISPSKSSVKRKRPATARPLSLNSAKRLRRKNRDSPRKGPRPTLADFGIAPDSPSADLKIKLSDGSIIRVHRVIISKCAPKLAHQGKPEVGILGKPTTVRHFLDACYSNGAIPEGCSRVGLLRLAERFGFEKLSGYLMKSVMPKKGGNIFVSINALKEFGGKDPSADMSPGAKQLKNKVIRRIMGKLDEETAKKMLAKIMA